MNKHCKNLLLVASLFGASSIILASIGAHGAYEGLSANNLLETFSKAVDYSFYNAIALIGLAVLSQLFEKHHFHLAGYSIALGGFIFQTSLFLYTLAGMKWLTSFTPFGGMLMILGWIMVGVLTIYKPRNNI